MKSISTTLVLALLPIILIELALKAVCLRDWFRRQKLNGLGRMAWLLIFLFVTMIGPLAYLVYGRRSEGE